MAVGDTNFIQALGAGGNVDTTKLVSDLVAAARAPEQSRIDAARKKNEVAVTSLSALRSGLNGLLDRVTQLSDRNRLNKTLVTSSEPSKLLGEPTTYGGAIPAMHSVQTTQLAQAQRVASIGYATTTEHLNAGSAFTLSFLVGNPDVTSSLTVDAIDGAAGSAEQQKFTPSSFGSNKEYTLTIGGSTLTATNPTDISDLVSKLQADANYDSSAYTISEGTGSSSGSLVITWADNGDQSVSTLSLADTAGITTSLTNTSTDGDAGTAEQQLFTPSSFGSNKEYTLTIGGSTLTATNPTDISDLVSKLQSDTDYDSSSYTVSEGTGSDSGKIKITWIDSGNRASASLSLTTDGNALTKTVSVQAGYDTPSGIASAINSAKIGIKARVISDGSDSTPYKIILEGKTGAKNQFSLSGGPAALSFDFDTPLQAATDASFILDGMAMKRESNTVNDAITGVSFTMTSTSNAPITLDVKTDTAGIKSAVQGFIDAYNSYSELHSRLTGRVVQNDDYAGSLSNDSVLNGIFREVRGLIVKISSKPTTEIRTWADLGVSVDRFGKMSLEEAAFNKALSNYPEEIQTALTGDRPIASTAEDNAGGLAGDLYSRLHNLLKGSGRFSNVESSRSLLSNRLDKRQEKLDSRIAAINERYLAQFSAMDAALQQYKSLASSMNSMLGLNKSNTD
jgi:flagellar hook-associated protein 2